MLPAYKPVLTLTSNNYLPIETVSWLRIERNERKCSKCDLNEIGDQFHYIFRCNLFNADRRNHVPMANVRFSNNMPFKCVNVIVRNFIKPLR